MHSLATRRMQAVKKKRVSGEQQAMLPEEKKEDQQDTPAPSHHPGAVPRGPRQPLQRNKAWLQSDT